MMKIQRLKIPVTVFRLVTDFSQQKIN